MIDTTVLPNTLTVECFCSGIFYSQVLSSLHLDWAKARPSWFSPRLGLYICHHNHHCTTTWCSEDYDDMAIFKGWCVSMPGMINKAVFTTVEVVQSLCKPVSLPGKIDKAVFTTVKVVQACLSAGKVQDCSFNNHGGTFFDISSGCTIGASWVGWKHLSGFSLQVLLVQTDTGSHGASGIVAPAEPKRLAGRE